MNKIIDIQLRPTNSSDLETLFLFQLDEEANYLAAFTSKKPSDRSAFIDKWTKLLTDTTVTTRTIIYKNKIVGSISKYEIKGTAEITYWIGKEFWKKGIAKSALQSFLEIEKSRPIFGRVAFDNIGSKKVLESCGFSKVGTQIGFSNARQKEIEEFVYELK